MHRRALVCLVCLLITGHAVAAGRTTIAVAPFTPRNDAPVWVGVALADSLSSRVGNQIALNAVTLRQVNAAMDQLGIDSSGLADPQLGANLGRLLGADSLVAGEYAVTGDRLGVSMRVIDTATASLIAWNKNSFPLGGLVAAEARLAGSLATALGIEEPTPVDTQRAFGTKDLSALEKTTRASMILGRQSLSPRAADPLAPVTLSTDELAEATSLLREALEADPTYSRARATLAIAQALGGDAAGGWQTLEQAMASGAGDDSVAILGGAFIRMRQGRIEDAVEILRAAVARRPGFLHARGNLGHLFNHFGRFRESRATFRAYAEAAPKQPWVLAQIGYANARLGKRDQAIADTEAALALLPDSPYLQLELASRYLDAKNLDAAQKTLEQILVAAPETGRVHVRLGYVQLLRGDDRAAIHSATLALKYATSQRERRERAYAHLNLTRAYGHLRELDRAFAHLGAAKAEGLSSFDEIELDPALEALRADPRYAGLTE